MKNLINCALVAEKKLFLLFAAALMCLSSCSKGDSSNNNDDDKLTAEEASFAVMEGEKERLPLTLQSMQSVSNITIDSIHLYLTIEPMEGYMYTTWEAGNKKTSMVVAVTDIRSSEEHEGYIEWRSDWGSTYRAFIMSGIEQELNDLKNSLPQPPRRPSSRW